MLWWRLQELVEILFWYKDGVPRWSTPEDHCHVGVVDAPLGVTVATKRALVDLVLVEISQKRLDPCGDTPPPVGNTAASMADPDVSAILVSQEPTCISIFSVGMEDSDDDVFRRSEGVRIPADYVQKELAARVTMADQGVELRVPSDAMAAEIAPLVSLEGVLTAQIGPGRFGTIEPKSWKLDVLPNERLPECSGLEGMLVRRVLSQLVT